MSYSSFGTAPTYVPPVDCAGCTLPGSEPGTVNGVFMNGVCLPPAALPTPSPCGGAIVPGSSGGGTAPMGPLAKAQAFWNASTTNKLIVAGGAVAVLGLLWMALRGKKSTAPVAVAKANRRRRYHANASRRRSARCSPLKRRIPTCRCSAPAKYRRMGATRRSDYAFRECWGYPIRFRSRSGRVNVAQTKRHIRAASQRFAKWQRRYPKTTRARIRSRIMSAKRQYGIGAR